MKQTGSCTDDRLTFTSRRAQTCATLGLMTVISVSGCAQAIATQSSRALPVQGIPDSISVLATIDLGYARQPRSTITGAVSSVSLGDSPRRAQVRSLAELLQGRIAGLAVEPRLGGGVSMRVRGASSFFGAAPLVIVDGNPLPAGVALVQLLETIDPNDVIRVDVLKDVSSTAIYGARGSAGVVLITMRKRAQ